MKVNIILFISIIVLICTEVFIISYNNVNKFPEIKNLTPLVSSNTNNFGSPEVNNLTSTYKINNLPTSNSKWVNDVINTIESRSANLNPNVLKLSLIAYEHAEREGITNNPLLTIVDYSKPSTERRLWVIDLNQRKVLINTWVAHGKNSGNINANSFSNRPESLESSIGVFVTKDIYSGKHGNSLRIQGLESGFNDNAYKRSIVFHGASYVSEAIAKAGKLGHSWGCFAVSENVISSLVNMIKDKVLVVAYFPDKNWLRKSIFLN